MSEPYTSGIVTFKGKIEYFIKIKLNIILPRYLNVVPQALNISIER
jgi:hypothetical protein